MRDETDWAQLARYLAGECTPAEVRDLEAALERDPHLRARVDDARRVWARADAATRPAERVDTDAAWGRMAARLRAGTPPAPLQSRPAVREPGRERRREPLAAGRRRGLPAWGARVAAGLLVAAGLTWLAVPRAPDAPDGPVPMRAFTTTPGERAIVDLRDGTHVVLAAASTLRVPEDFNATTRRVELDGEAYFVVAHDAAKPFSVHAARAVTQVLGTEFSVRAYADEPGVDVLVRSGRVALRGDEAPSTSGTVLTRGQAGHLDSTGQTSVRDGVDVALALAWTDGRLAFDRTPMREVLPRLERWYDLTIQLADSSLGERRITASFQGEPPERVITALALLLDARAERHGQAVTFSARTRSR